jgi:hypothetical protein
MLDLACSLVSQPASAWALSSPICLESFWYSSLSVPLGEDRPELFIKEIFLVVDGAGLPGCVMKEGPCLPVYCIFA